MPVGFQRPVTTGVWAAFACLASTVGSLADLATLAAAAEAVSPLGEAGGDLDEAVLRLVTSGCFMACFFFVFLYFCSLVVLLCVFVCGGS